MLRNAPLQGQISDGVYMQGKISFLVISIFAVGQMQLTAQLSTSNLRGAYYVRQLAMDGYPQYNAYSAQGTAVFDGSGGFAFLGTEIDTRNNVTPHNITVNGTYSLTSSGILSMTSLVATGEVLYGGFSNNVLVASATESSDYGLLVAIPASQTVSNRTLSGNYRFVSMDFLNGKYESVRNATFSAAANGQGSLGDLSITGQAANLSTPSTTQTINAASYNFDSNGSGTLRLPTSANASSSLINGNKTLYVSSDGNLVIGGSSTGYDMIFGVKSLPGTASASIFPGTYYLGGLALDNSQGDILYSSQLLSYSGSLRAGGQGTYFSSTRYNLDGSYPYNETLSLQNGGPNSIGLLDFESYQFYFGSDGQIVLGTGTKQNYEIDLLVRTPSFTGTGSVFLDPGGVVNAASFAPITNPIAPGELITLFGNGLAGRLTVADGAPFPTSLGGVQVTINGTMAPIYYVSPTQVSVIVPYSMSTDNSLASIQLTNNGVQSNTVQVYTAPTAPGIFSQSQSGAGTGAILRQDSTIVSSGNSVARGETIQIFLTGLGLVTPANPAGAAGQSNQPSVITGNVKVFIGDRPATVSYAGLAPGLAGLYQINAIIPNNVSSGNAYVDISTDDAYHTQVTVPIQ